MMVKGRSGTRRACTTARSDAADRPMSFMRVGALGATDAPGVEEEPPCV